MKRLVLAAAFFFAVVGIAQAIILAWDSDPEWGEDVGIRIYWEDAVTGEASSLDFALPATSAEIPNSHFSMGTDYAFWATAFTATEESEDSNIVDAYYNLSGTWGPDEVITPPKSNHNRGPCFIGAVF
jgi:hypothetical protein